MKNQHKRGWSICKMTVLLLVIGNIYGIAQTPKVPTYCPDIIEKSTSQKRDSINKEPVTGEYDIMPQFSGGEVALLKFINENLVYPEDARNNKTEGKVIVRLLVTKEGKVEKIEVVRGITKSLNKEAMRIISMLPDWTPGEQVYTSLHFSRKKKVDVYYTIPVTFKLK